MYYDFKPPVSTMRYTHIIVPVAKEKIETQRSYATDSNVYSELLSSTGVRAVSARFPSFLLERPG